MSLLKTSCRRAERRDFPAVLELWRRVFNYQDEQLRVLGDLLQADRDQEVYHIRLMHVDGALVAAP